MAWETISCRKFADVLYALSFIFLVIFYIFFLIFWKIRPNLRHETFSENRNCGLLLGLPKSSATTPFMVAVAVCCWLDLRIIVVLTGADWDIQGEWKHGARGTLQAHGFFSLGVWWFCLCISYWYLHTAFAATFSPPPLPPHIRFHWGYSNKPIITITSVACGWAGGETQMRSPFTLHNGWTDGRMDRLTDRWTDHLTDNDI